MRAVRPGPAPACSPPLKSPHGLKLIKTNIAHIFVLNPILYWAGVGREDRMTEHIPGCLRGERQPRYGQEASRGGELWVPAGAT